MTHFWDPDLQTYQNEISVAEFCYLLPVYESSFSGMPISQETQILVRFSLNDLQIESFQIMRSGSPRWPTAAVTENSKNMKMTNLKIF